MVNIDEILRNHLTTMMEIDIPRQPSFGIPPDWSDEFIDGFKKGIWQGYRQALDEVENWILKREGCMGTEILAIPEEHLQEFCEFIKMGLSDRFIFPESKLYDLLETWVENTENNEK